MSAPVLVSRESAVGVIELARPEKFNCLSLAAFAAIDAALDGFEATDSGVRAVLVRAQGKNFCTGADLEEVKGLRQSAADLRDFIARGHRVFKRFEKSDLPVVAACQGLALAGGSELMLSCDVVFMAKDAKVGDQHAQFGLVPGWGGTQRFPRVIGLRRSLDLMFSARWIDADTALSWGLTNYVVEPEALHAEAMAYCQKLATRSRTGLATMKRLARQGMEGSALAGLTLEEQVVSAALLGEDVSEGLAAFEARRSPQFKG
ncbi:MAG: enoyl-CoA hydratase/isomerase family protein [Burkholderiales bacterium]